MRPKPQVGVEQVNQVQVEPIAPRTWVSAMKENREKWKGAADLKMEMLQQLGTWEKVDLPPGQKLIGTRWVFKRKWADGGYNLFKARLVAKGYVQEEGVDYGDTYAPVSSIITVRCLLAIAAARGYHMWQADVKMRFVTVISTGHCTSANLRGTEMAATKC